MSEASIPQGMSPPEPSSHNHSVRAVKELYIGIMSGTSLDGIDVAIVHFDSAKLELRSFYSAEFPEGLRRNLLELAAARTVEMDELVRTHFILAEQYANAVLNALKVAGLSKNDIRAIGLHGQTVRHIPKGEHRATLQLGSGPALAVLTEIDVVSDFRSADLALGGQGAPLVPMFDYHFLRSDSIHRLIVNIGGIANVTWLPKNAREEDVLAFDTGPGNMLIDSLVQKYYDRPYDENGVIASKGTINETIVSEMLSDPFFEEPPPKSTGRELFSESKLKDIHDRIAANQMRPEDAVAIFTEVTARAIVQSLQWTNARSEAVEIIVSGGGAFNQFLLDRISRNAGAAVRVVTSDRYDIPPKAKEAIAFAFFAKAFMEKISIHLPATTGARRRTTLGSLSLGK